MRRVLSALRQGWLLDRAMEAWLVDSGQSEVPDCGAKVFLGESSRIRR
jgi:hypothetical protein